MIFLFSLSLFSISLFCRWHGPSAADTTSKCNLFVDEVFTARRAAPRRAYNLWFFSSIDTYLRNAIQYSRSAATRMYTIICRIEVRPVAAIATMHYSYSICQNANAPKAHWSLGTKNKRRAAGAHRWDTRTRRVYERRITTSVIAKTKRSTQRSLVARV